MVIPTGKDIHDEYAHNIYHSQDAQHAMTHYTELHAQHFASILRALDSVPEGNGTMLDNTLCLWAVEVADGAHGFDRWPAVLAGGQGMDGRYMHYPRPPAPGGNVPGDDHLNGGTTSKTSDDGLPKYGRGCGQHARRDHSGHRWCNH